MTPNDTVASSTMVRWTWQSTPIEIGVDEAGAGPTVLLLPALSSISTRGEMRPSWVGLPHHRMDHPKGWISVLVGLENRRFPDPSCFV